MTEVNPRMENRAMMTNPLRWPRWPWLPLKRYRSNTWPDIAVMYADDTVEGQPVKVRFDPTFHKADPIVYPNVDALLDDGWVVD